MHFRRTIYSCWLRTCWLNLIAHILINLSVVFKITQVPLQFTFSTNSVIICQFFEFIRIVNYVKNTLNIISSIYYYYSITYILLKKNDIHISAKLVYNFCALTSFCDGLNELRYDCAKCDNSAFNLPLSFFFQYGIYI